MNGSEEFSRNSLSNSLQDFLENELGLPAVIAAPISNAIFDAVNILEYVENYFLNIESIVLPPRDGFANFVSVGPTIELTGINQFSGQADFLRGGLGSETGLDFNVVDSIQVYSENYVTVTYSDPNATFQQVDVYYREDTTIGSVQEIQQAVNDAPPSLLADVALFSLVTLGFNLDGVQYSLDAGDGARTAFEELLLDALTSDGNQIVDGTSSTDIIDNAYVDADGDSISDGGQTILAGDGNDRIYDGGGDDTVEGGAGRDIFFAGDGADSYDGGTDRDEVYYTTATAGLTIDAIDGANGTGIAAGDSFANIEYIHGSEFDDIIIADVERIFGRNGDDVLQDGAGAQRMIGGAGADTFRFIAGDGAQDRVADFTIGEDMFDVSLWGATQLSDLTIYESTNGQGSPQGRLNIEFNGETVRVDGLDTADIASLTADHFTFA